jgi:glycine/D-amino acid oxidase-like deaminating enzyme
MRADYDSKANAVSISLSSRTRAERADHVHPRAIVAVHDGDPVELQLLYPDLGIDEPLGAVSSAYGGIDKEALVAAVQAALAAPDRSVTLEVAVRSAA